MSDPISRKDDEEVLSSVRRKVNAERPDEEFDVKASGQERLVLTPQLRVDDEAVLRLEPQHARAAQFKDGAVSTSNPRVPLVSTTSDSDVFELSAKIAAFETAIGRIPDQWEPDGTGTDAYAGTALPAMNWPDLDQAEEGAPRDRNEPQVDPRETDRPAPLRLGGRGIDEKALEELVAEIVRAELKGPLGERITRNVRALVRREIQLAMAAQSDKQS